MKVFTQELDNDASTRQILTDPTNQGRSRSLSCCLCGRRTDSLTQSYGDYQSVDYLIKGAKERYGRAVHNAQATVDRYQFIYDDKVSQIRRIRAKEFPDWMTEPTPKMLCSARRSR